MLRGGRTIVGETLTNTISGSAFTADTLSNSLDGRRCFGGHECAVPYRRFSRSDSLNVSGAITGTTGTATLYLADAGTKILGGTNTFTNMSRLWYQRHGSQLDYGTNNTSKLADASGLELGWKDSGIVTLAWVRIVM
jgi:hypothetical protein